MKTLSAPSCEYKPAAHYSGWKKVFLFFFRFGICPGCIMGSMMYSIYALVNKRNGQKNSVLKTDEYEANIWGMKL